MPEIDRENFGKFIQELRKEKGYTQKELAQKLFLSDKAVSKWERGISLPDIQILIPLADILGATVTELLEGKRLEGREEMKAGEVEKLVKKALTLSGEPQKCGRKELQRRGLVFGAGLMAAAWEVWLLARLGDTLAEGFPGSVFLGEILTIIFGAYFWFGVRERLPAYYDENRISFYSHGIFKMNIPGVSFNNRNWPHIVRAMRIWSVAGMAAMPLAALVFHWLLPDARFLAEKLFLLLFLCGMFVPIYLTGRQWQ